MYIKKKKSKNLDFKGNLWLENQEESKLVIL